MSPILKLTQSDFLKGLIVAVITAPLTLIIQALQGGSEIDLKTVGVVALIAFCSYIVKNLGTDEQGYFLGNKKL